MGISLLILSGIVAGVVIGAQNQSKQTENSQDPVDGNQKSNTITATTSSISSTSTNCPDGLQLVAGKYLVNNTLTTKEKLSVLTNLITYNSTGSIDKNTLLAHNTYRSLLGKPNMTISTTLKNFAQNYSNYLASNNLFRHSGGPYGENLYRASGGGSVIKGIILWWKEFPIYNGENIPNGDFSGYGHYTQMIWDTSVRVGCGQATSTTGYLYVTCNYDPPGNYRGQSVSEVINGTVC